MENERYTEKLAKSVFFALIIGVVGYICWYFSSIIVYILVSVVVSLLARPIMTGLQKIRIKGRNMPDWIAAAIALVLLFTILASIVTLIVPIVSGIIKGISLENIESAAGQISVPLSNLNDFLRSNFPDLGDDFKIENSIFKELKSILDVSMVSSVLGSAASVISGVGIALFSIIFISFFFIKDGSLFGKMVGAIVPDKHETNAIAAINDIGHLLSRYFSGVAIEMFGVALINFLGLYFITRLGFNVSIGIAFITGLLNIIPYVGPLFGGLLGTILALVVKYSSLVPIGLDVSFGWFTLILITIFCFTQLVDNFLYQPVIYSSSIKAKPLEIFIVLLIAGHLAGPIGMIIAIPSYTIIRVIAFRFFGHIKAIERLEKN